mmetsp:Transcript_42923/g.60197  ORF Transcript_42923/g.60197 Transcript_42923/m.60197 type:complete len:109 (-) Transcript_42923:3-329(-)
MLIGTVMFAEKMFLEFVFLASTALFLMSVRAARKKDITDTTKLMFLILSKRKSTTKNQNAHRTLFSVFLVEPEKKNRQIVWIGFDFFFCKLLHNKFEGRPMVPTPFNF